MDDPATEDPREDEEDRDEKLSLSLEKERASLRSSESLPLASMGGGVIQRRPSCSGRRCRWLKGWNAPAGMAALCRPGGAMIRPSVVTLPMKERISSKYDSSLSGPAMEIEAL